MIRSIAALLLFTLFHLGTSFVPASNVRQHATSAIKFTTTTVHQYDHKQFKTSPLYNSGNDNDSSDDAEAATATKLSLEEKMKNWEATEDEIKAATLGGVVPESANRSDAFDVGLYIAFPLMVLSGLALVAFPFLMGNLDVTSVGPPPTS